MPEPAGPAIRTIDGTLLTVDYLTVDNNAWIRLWISTENDVHPVLDPSFEPYFYVVPSERVDPDALADRLADTRAGDASPVRAEVVTRQQGLDDIDVVQVVARHPQDVPALRSRIGAMEQVRSTREDDVLFVNRYMIDERVRPLTLTQAKVVDSDAVPGAYKLETLDQYPDRDLDLDLMAFDLEVYNPHVTPDASRDPIVAASIASTTGVEEVLTKPDDASDRELIQTLAQRIREVDPDVLVTYNGDNFDWPYLVDRAEDHGFDLKVGRDGSEPDIRQAGRSKAVTVTGRGNVDGYQMAQRDLPGVKVKTLERVAEHLGVGPDEHTDLDSTNMAEIWDDPAQREELLEYALDDAQAALGIVENLLGLQVGLCRRTFQDLSDGSRMGRGRQADFYLLGEAHERGILAPDRNAHQTSTDYEGGVVLEPPAGIHENVVYLDFSSMYPTIMMEHNVSPETYVEPGEDPGVEVYEAPEVGHRFRKQPDGFFKRLLQELIDRRNEIKAQRDRASDDDKIRSLNVEEQAVKVLTNAFYGYMGWNGARWQSMPCAEATTAWGRHFIQRSVDMAEEMGLEVLYGDTDSVMVEETDDVDALVDRVNEELPIELEVEAVFDVLFFTGAKKRYAGRTREGETLVRGLEVRRGDWCEYAKDVQQTVIDTLLESQDPDEATRLAREAIEDLRDGNVPVEALTIHKTLTKDPDYYASKIPHAPEFEAPAGSKIGYVIVEDDSDLVSERARLADVLDESETLDVEYYMQKQVVPAAHRVLSYFGVTQNELKGQPSQVSLEEWSN